jgi:hypothetical protein
MKVVEPISINDAILTTTDVTEADYSAWSSGTTYDIEDRVIYVDPSSTVTITIATPGVISWTAHGLSNDQIVTFTTTDTLPTGISIGTAYYIVNKTTDTFQISTTKEGTATVTTGSQAGTHTCIADMHLIFESLTSGNLANTPPAPGATSNYWIKVSSTNRWKMFDESVSTRTTNSGTVDVTMDVVGHVTAVACLNVDTASVQVIMTDSVAGEVYNSTETMTSTVGINNWWNYFFKPIIKKQDVLFSDLPSYSGAEIQVIFTKTGGMVEVGSLVLGTVNEFGDTQYGMSVGIIDFSVKQSDTFGNVTVVKRGFKKKASLTTLIDNNEVDQIVNLLTEFRAIPVVYEGSDQFGSSLIYGFYRDFDVVVSYPTASLMDIEIEGLK